MSLHTKHTVTLKHAPLAATYTVTQIRGGSPIISVPPFGDHEGIVVRVGDFLSERQVTNLGRVAELIIRGGDK